MRASLPPGFRYAESFIDSDEEAALIGRMRALPFEPFKFHQYYGKRRIVSYGYHYDFDARDVAQGFHHDRDLVWTILANKPLHHRGRVPLLGFVPPDRADRFEVAVKTLNKEMHWRRPRRLLDGCGYFVNDRSSKLIERPHSRN